VTSLGWDDVLRKKPRPPRFALEIFAGTARITKALHTVGFYAFPIDICIAEHHNLLDTCVEHDILHLLQSGRVSFLWLGMPCTSFSRARKWDGLGPGPLRDLFHLNGFSWLNDADKKKCELAMTFSGSPFGFYKSVNSFLFHMHWRILAAAMPGRCHR
jgi:hypothetical protein